MRPGLNGILPTFSGHVAEFDLTAASATAVAFPGSGDKTVSQRWHRLQGDSKCNNFPCYLVEI